MRQHTKYNHLSGQNKNLSIWWGAGAAKRPGFENLGPALPERGFESHPHRHVIN